MKTSPKLPAQMQQVEKLAGRYALAAAQRFGSLVLLIMTWQFWSFWVWLGIWAGLLLADAGIYILAYAGRRLQFLQQIESKQRSNHAGRD